MEPVLPEELVMLQRSVREFVDQRLAPLEREIEEKDEIPRAVIEAMAGMGLFGLGFSEEVGGQGFGKLGYCVAVEQLARANASLWNVIGGSAGLCGTAPARRREFAAALQAAGCVVRSRYSLGADIAAGCGQLVRSEQGSLHQDADCPVN